MRPGDSDELLSAYLDREVTPAEREAVEARLDASPDTRAELDAIAELSLCLRTLDRPEAPADFQASIMQALAGRRLPPALVTKPPVRRSRREWIVTFAAIVTTACGLFIAVSSWQPHGFMSPPKTTTEFSIGMSDAIHPTAPVSFDAPDSGLNRRADLGLTTGDRDGDGLMDEHRRLTMMEANGGALKPRSAPMPAAVAPMVASGSGAPFRNSEVDDTRLASTVDTTPEAGALEKVALNDVLNAWASTDFSDRYVANIDLQVVDVRRTATEFQLLLSNNGVVNVPLDEAPLAKKSGESKDEKLTAPGAPAAEKQRLPEEYGEQSMIAVYVDSTPEIVTKSLDELAQKYNVVRLRVQTPLALSREAEDQSGDVAGKEVEVASRSKRLMIDNVTNAYATQQLATAANWADSEGPVDALLVLEDTPVVSESLELQQRRMIARSQNEPAAAAAGIAKMQAGDKRDASQTQSPNQYGQFFCSEVRLPLVNNQDALTTNTIDGNSVPMPDLAYSRALTTNSPLLGNNLARQNSNSITESGRYRQYTNRDGTNANPVRVLVVFQDAPVTLKAKAAAPKP